MQSRRIKSLRARKLIKHHFALVYKMLAETESQKIYHLTLLKVPVTFTLSLGSQSKCIMISIAL